MSRDRKGSRSGPEEKRLQGHWLLATMGKTVLRPGGLEMTEALLEHARPLPGETVVEFGPGVGRTARLLLGTSPARYIGVDPNPEGAPALRKVLADFPHVSTRVVTADAKSTGLPDESADVVIGEAMLTMMNPRDKAAIVAEAARILKPGGRYVVHEMGLAPENIDPDTAAELQKEISRTVKVGARPLTMDQWRALLTDAGFSIRFAHQNPMNLLEPRRILADEGLLGTARIAKNMIVNPAGRHRMLTMRAVFRKYGEHLCGVGFVATASKG